MPALSKTFLLSTGFLLACSTVWSATEAERELKRVMQERNDAVVVAVDPINRRAQAALDKLLKRAIQDGDLDGAVKIRDALRSLDPKSLKEAKDTKDSKEEVTAKDPIEAAAVTPELARVLNTTWKWWGDQTLTFLPGGKARHSSGTMFTWELTDKPNVLTGATKAKQPFMLTIKPDFKSATWAGAVNGETRRVEK